MPRRVLGASTNVNSNETDQNPIKPKNDANPVTSLAANPDSSEPNIASLRCPICSEEMITLAQLNRHLDDEHTVENKSTDGTGRRVSLNLDSDFKNWFKKSLIQTIIGNDDSTTQIGQSDEQSLLVKEIMKDQRERIREIPKNHWQKPSNDDTCSYPGCDRRLGLKNGMVNCRKCGKLFCEAHTLYRMKLDTKLQNNCKSGVWCRVCLGCFQDRECWKHPNDGLYVDEISKFISLRSKRTISSDLNRLTLEKRMYKLLDRLVLVNSGKCSVGDYRRYERTLAPWDGNGTTCNICHSKFSFLLRRHHCRICGSAVCSDVDSGCSMPVPIDLAAKIMNTSNVNDNYKTLYEGDIVSKINIRICINCKRILFDERLCERKSKKSAESGVFSKIAVFQTLITRISRLENEMKDTLLINYFSKMEDLAKEVGDIIKQGNLRQDNSDEMRIYGALEQRMVGYLRDKLPKLRKIQKEKLDAEKRRMNKTKEAVDKPKKKKLSLRDTRLKREKLMVLNEQKFMVEQLHEQYKKQRKFDDLQPLDDNLRDLDREIGSLEAELGDEAFMN